MLLYGILCIFIVTCINLVNYKITHLNKPHIQTIVCVNDTHTLIPLVENVYVVHMCLPKESWILTDYVHDIGCHYCFVVFAPLHLTETK